MSGEKKIIEKIDSGVMKIFPKQSLYKYKFIPVKQIKNEIHIGVSEKKSIPFIKNYIETIYNLKTVFHIYSEEILDNSLKHYFHYDKDTSSKLKLIYKTENESENMISGSTISCVNSIIEKALKMNASDIHLRPAYDKFSIDYRIDGVLKEIDSYEKREGQFLTARIKVMADMDISVKRLPQDGKLKALWNNKTIDIRVSSLPINYGEKIVLRLLGDKEKFLNIKNLGLQEKEEKLLLSNIEKPNGIILITGPTGSGKSTTLYSCLNHLNRGSKNIVTIEDPIEYELEGISQSQINEGAGLNFSSILRSVLRQDPDIILIGEIRDSETADIAVKASLTGHLILSTLHTNNAKGAVSRLLDMKVEPFLLADSLQLSAAQRLIRVLCPECRQRRRFTEEEISYYGVPDDIEFGYFPGRCFQCGYTGYTGRKALFEFFEITGEVRDLIRMGKSLSGVEMKEISRVFWEEVKRGVTSINEIGVVR